MNKYILTNNYLLNTDKISHFHVKNGNIFANINHEEALNIFYFGCSPLYKKDGHVYQLRLESTNILTPVFLRLLHEVLACPRVTLIDEDYLQGILDNSMKLIGDAMSEQELVKNFSTVPRPVTVR
jgi:hypothetical protein